MDNYQKLIQEICEELGITMRIVSKGWIMILEKGKTTRFLAQTKFDLNPYVLGTIMDDKYATFEVLKEKKIPIIQHEIIFQNDNRNEYEDKYKMVQKYFEDHHNDIVIKDNKGSLGIGVYHVTDKKDIPYCLDKIFAKSYSLSVCPFYRIKAEYRLIMLQNECVLMYGKRKAKVVGDGKSTLRALLKDFNPYYFADKLEEKQYDQVLECNEEYEYSWKYNLSEGAIAFSIESKELKEKLLQIVEQIKQTITLEFCSVDIVETEEGEFLVMELNSGVTIYKYCNFIKNGREIAKNIYKKAIEAMFQESSRGERL